MPHIIPSIYNVSEFEDASVEQIVAILRKEYLEPIQRLRNANPEAQKRMKTGLPAFTLGTFRDRIDNDNFISSDYLIYDVDGLNTTQLMSLKRRTREFSYFVFETPRGKGLKFVIKMDKPLDKTNYDANYLHYMNYFIDDLGIAVDRAYRSKHTFFSHDAECSLNTEAKLFPVVDSKIVKQIANVDITADLKEELIDVCNFIRASGKLDYHEWVTLALGLKSMGESGKDLFLFIGQADTDPDHAHRDWSRKWDTVGTPKATTVASVYWLAFKRGYTRKEHFLEDGRGQVCPFVVRPDGMYIRDKKNKVLQRVFGFTSIAINYTVIDKSDGNKVVMVIDDHEVIVPQKKMATPQALRDVILSNKPGLTYMSMSGTIHYDALLNYLDRTQNKTMVEYAPGIGNVAPGMWNLGNIVISDNNVIPYESIIYADKDHGYLLDDVSDTIYTEASKHFFVKLAQMFEFYGNRAAIAIGWAFANIYYSRILSKCGGFPVLFIHGRTKSGKSQLAHLILAMFGIKNPENSSDFKLSMEKATANAMSRVKDRACGIPTMFDEYGSNSKHNDEHYVTLKSLFDASGRTMARFSNDNRTRKLNVKSGSIFTACNKEQREEGVNRCVYIDMDGVSDANDAKEFERLFQGLGRRDMGAFLPLSITRTTYREWSVLYDEAYEVARQVKTGSRVHANYAMVMAGYNVVRKAFQKHVSLPEISDEWWVNQITSTMQYIVDSDPAQIMIDHLINMAAQPDFYKWMKVREENVGYDSQAIALSFYLKGAMIDVKQKYRLDLPSELDLRNRIREHPYYTGGGTEYLGSGLGNKHCLRIRIPPVKEAEEKNQQSDVPF